MYDKESVSVNKLLKVVVENNQPIMCGTGRNTDGIMTSTTDVNVKFYESDPLSSEKIQQIKTGFGSTTLTKTDEATNPMGNIKATLSVKYKWTFYSNPKLLKMISATSKYERIKYEGVKPKSSSLYWNAEGAVYYLGKFDHKGDIGETLNFSSPTFSNVKIMANGQSISPIAAGVTYTLKCSRGVNIDVRVSLV